MQTARDQNQTPARDARIVQPRRFHPWKTAWVLAVVLAFAVYVTVRARRGSRHPAWTGKTMGTTYSVKLVDSPLTASELEQLKANLQTAFDEVSREMSHYAPDSELSLFNAATSTAPQEVSAALAGVVRFALEISRASGGAFDPTLGPLIDAWGFGTRGRRDTPPGDTEIAAAAKVCGYKHLSVVGTALRKDIPGLQLNLGAVAKGYGVDRAAAVVLSAGVSNLFVEIGGEVAAFGHNPKGGKWRIGIETPDPSSLPGESIEAVIVLSGNAAATSGDYRNFFTDAAGRRYAHILDPATARPIQHDLASVSVVARDCMTADALATALFVMGAERGRSWIEGYPGAEALFIVRNANGNFRQEASSGFAAATGYEVPAVP